MPARAAFSWYTYSPTRVRYPYARGVLLEMYREAKQRLRDPVLAWADVSTIRNAPPYHQSPRQGRPGPGELERAGGDDRRSVREHDQDLGPGPRSRLLPDPGNVDGLPLHRHPIHAADRGRDDAFYDWYADLPVASPQVFGDQTDVPESGDWWDATYLMMWGSNVPVTRPPDAHWKTEVRNRGTKVVSVSPDFADNTKFADEWLPAQAGTDAALAMAMAMGHVILKEFFVARRVPFFVEYVRTYTDLPFLITLVENVEHGGLVPGKFLTEGDLHRPFDELREQPPGSAWKTVLLDAASGRPVVPNGSMGFRYGESGEGKWNLDLEGVVPALSLRDAAKVHPESAEVLLPFFQEPDGTGEVMRRGVPVTRVGEKLVTTVFDLMLAQYGVRREDLPGEWPQSYDDATKPYTPAWQEEVTGVPAQACMRIAREFATNAEESNGRSLIIMGAGICQWFHGDATYRAILAMLMLTGCPGRNGGGWAHYVGQEKCGPITGWLKFGQCIGVVPPAPDHDRHRVLVHAYRPVALRRLLPRRARLASRRGSSRRHAHRRHHRPVRPAGVDAVLSPVRRQPARPRRHGQRGGRRRPGQRCRVVRR